MPNNIARYCVEMLRPFGQTSKVQSEFVGYFVHSFKMPLTFDLAFVWLGKMNNGKSYCFIELRE